MRICIFGAGAVGGLLAARLAGAGEQVTVIARGLHLAAIRAHGLKLIEENGAELVAEVTGLDNAGAGDRQDLVILCVKAHQLAAVVADLAPLYGPHTMVMTTQNGIPWWYFLKHGGRFEGRRLESVDPGGFIAAHLPAERLIAAVIYPAAEIAAPGVIRHIEGERISVAEIDDERTARVEAVAAVLRKAGFKARVVTDIRSELWTKLWGNLSFNPISALTQATLVDICRFPLTRELAAAMMGEAQAVGEALGIKFRVSLDKRIAGAESVGAHKTSMLQDIEAGRAIEAGALVGAVVDLGRLVGLPTPHIDAVYALVKLLDRTLQEAHGRLKIESL